jgi:aminoglycoside 3-N-acetyltransferase
MAIGPNELLEGLGSLLPGGRPVVVHASLSAFGEVDGGAETVVAALLAIFPTVLVPAFTYKTMITPRTGPPDNGITYGTHQDSNLMAEYFTPQMPVDRMIGIIPDTLRRHPRARRSHHPIQSFAGVNADAFLAAQSMADPLAPLGLLEQADGWVVLLGVDHTTNTSIHYAEKLAGRRTFVRWALTPEGIVECPNFPGCSAGFQAILPDVEKYTRKVQIGKALVQALPSKMLFRAVIQRIKEDPLALLCRQEDCERCNQVRMK